MRAKVHKFINMTVLGLALVSPSIPAWAGAVSRPEVTISGDYATGSMAGARYSQDSQQFIGCINNSRIGSSSVTCLAMDKTGRSLTCSSTVANFVVAVKAITDFSRISFGVNSDASTCRLRR